MLTLPSHIQEKALKILKEVQERNWSLACAESCTGGLIAATFTSIPGASQAFKYGLVTYSNEAKISLLNVDEITLKNHGAVSEAVAVEMARGVITAGDANLAVAVTGVAGPGGGSKEKPVGLVHVAAASMDGKLLHSQNLFRGDRNGVRTQTVTEAMNLLLQIMA